MREENAHHPHVFITAESQQVEHLQFCRGKKGWKAKKKQVQMQQLRRNFPVVVVGVVVVEVVFVVVFLVAVNLSSLLLLLL